MDDLLSVLDRREARNHTILDEALAGLSTRKSVASRTFRRAIEMTDLPANRKVLFINRFVRHVEDLEIKKRRSTRLAALLNGTVSIGSVVTPALLSIQILPDDSSNFIFWTTWSVSLLTGISTAFLSLFKLNQATEIYSDVLRRLISEGSKYLSLSDTYATKYELNAHDGMFPLFSSNVEAIILSETRVGSGGGGGGGGGEEREDRELKEVATRNP